MNQRERRSVLHFFQFGLRTLLVGVILLSVLLGSGLIWWRWPFQVEQALVIGDPFYEFTVLREMDPDEQESQRVKRESLTRGGRKAQANTYREVFQVYRDLSGFRVRHVRHGPAIIFDAAGNRVREEHWLHGKLHGPWTHWDADGKVTAQGEYRHGKRHGVWILHGKKVVEREAGANVRSLVSQNYIRRTEYREGVMLRDTMHTDEDESIWDYEGGPPYRFLRQTRNGQKLEEHFLGVIARRGDDSILGPVGLHTTWYLSGQKKEEVRHENGRRAGEAAGWYPDATRRYQGAWKNGLEHGRWTWWNEDGAIEREIEFREILPEGLAENVVDQRILEELGKPTQANFNDTPLLDVLQFLSDLHGIKIAFNRSALKARGFDPAETLITWKHNHDPNRPLEAMSLRAALQMILDPFDLTPIVRGNSVMIEPIPNPSQ